MRRRLRLHEDGLVVDRDTGDLVERVSPESSARAVVERLGAVGRFSLTTHEREERTWRLAQIKGAA